MRTRRSLLTDISNGKSSSGEPATKRAKHRHKHVTVESGGSNTHSARDSRARHNDSTVADRAGERRLSADFGQLKVKDEPKSSDTPIVNGIGSNVENKSSNSAIVREPLDESSSEELSQKVDKREEGLDHETSADVEAKPVVASSVSCSRSSDTGQCQSSSLSTCGNNGIDGMSELELQVQRNVEERMRMLRAFNIDGAKHSLLAVAPSSSSSRKTDTAKKQPRAAKSSSTSAGRRLVRRPTRRSQRISARGHTDGRGENGQAVSDALILSQQQQQGGDDTPTIEERRLGPLSVAECLPELATADRNSQTSSADQSQLDKCRSFMSHLDSACWQTDGSRDGAAVELDAYSRVVCSLAADSEQCWRRVLSARVTSLAWCPLRQRRILAVADKTGALGLWHVNCGADIEQQQNVKQEHDVQVLQPHRQGIAQVSFPGDGCAGGMSAVGQADVACFTTGYDGITRRLDVSRMTFDQVHALSDKDLPAYTSGHVHVDDGRRLLVGCSDGRVFGVDPRETGECASVVLSASRTGVRSLSGHPSRAHLLLLVERPRTLSLWDLRRCGRSVSPLWRHELPQSCHGAALDRASGDSLVAACMDDSLRVFAGVNAVADASPVRPVCTMRHDNHTGRWLTPLRPSWLPGSAARFVIGCMLRPRRVQVFDVCGASAGGGRVCHMIMGESLQSVLSAVACHPSVPAVAGANSSGRVYVFQ